jgi:hypothetical protein
MISFDKEFGNIEEHAAKPKPCTFCVLLRCVALLIQSELLGWEVI